MKFKIIALLMSCFMLTGCSDNKKKSSVANSAETTTILTTTTTTTTTTIKNTTEAITESPTETPAIYSNSNTFIGSTLTLDIPKNWMYIQTSMYNYTYPTAISIFQNGNFSFILEEVEIINKNSDEIFKERIIQFFNDQDCDSVDIYSLADVKYAKPHYTNGKSHIYMFANNEHLYQFDVSGLSLLPDGEDMVLNALISVRYEDINDINKYCQEIPNLSSEEKTFFHKSISSFLSFAYPDTIKINSCCETSINSKRAFVYDLEYISLSDTAASGTFIYYPDTNENIMAGNTYSDTINQANSDVITYDANDLNQVLKNYYKQFDAVNSTNTQSVETPKQTPILVDVIERDDVTTVSDLLDELNKEIDKLKTEMETEINNNIGDVQEPEIVTTEKQTEAPIEEPVSEVETKPDNSRQIKRLESKIANCYSNIELYESFISRRQNDIISYQPKLESAIADLEKAQSNLEKAQENKVHTYSAEKGWHYAPDAGAIADAESKITQCQSRVDSYNEIINKLNSEIEDYRNQINEKNIEIESYQAEIESLL